MRAALLGAVVLSLLVWWAKAPPRDKEEEEEEEEDTALGVHVYLYCEVDHAWVEDVRKLLPKKLRSERPLIPWPRVQMKMMLLQMKRMKQDNKTE